MAFNALKQCRSSMQSSFAFRGLASSTRPKLATSTASGPVHQERSKGGLIGKMKDTFGPIWVVIAIIGGMVSVAGCIGIHTAKQQLFHSPSVQVTKRKRGCIPEVDLPDDAILSSGKFENKSFLRKVAHIQEKPPSHDGVPTKPRDASIRAQEVQSLKSMGIRGSKQ